MRGRRLGAALAAVVVAAGAPVGAKVGANVGADAGERVKGRLAPAIVPAPPEGLGQVLFWRSGTIMGGSMGCGVNAGDERISALGAGHYFIVALPPGNHVFNARSEARDVLEVAVRPAETAYVKCTIRIGIVIGRPNLSPSTAAEYENKRGDLKYVDSDDIGPKVRPDPASIP